MSYISALEKAHYELSVAYDDLLASKVVVDSKLKITEQEKTRLWYAMAWLEDHHPDLHIKASEFAVRCEELE